MILIHKFEEMYENHEPALTWDVEDPTKSQEQLDDQLHFMNGEMNIPLTYVTREQIVPMLANDNTSTMYTTTTVKVNVHAPHGTSNKPIMEFQINNGMLLDGLTLIMREMAAWTYVKPFAKKPNGRGTATAHYNHYLGPNTFNDQTLAAENVHNKATYVGGMSHWNYEKYAILHMKQHEIPESMMEYEDNGTNEGTNVCHLMGGIKIDKF
jgi:hypothetical protein